MHVNTTETYVATLHRYQEKQILEIQRLVSYRYAKYNQTCNLKFLKYFLKNNLKNINCLHLICQLLFYCQ